MHVTWNVWKSLWIAIRTVFQVNSPIADIQYAPKPYLLIHAILKLFLRSEKGGSLYENMSVRPSVGLPSCDLESTTKSFVVISGFHHALLYSITFIVQLMQSVIQNLEFKIYVV